MGRNCGVKGCTRTRNTDDLCATHLYRKRAGINLFAPVRGNSSVKLRDDFGRKKCPGCMTWRPETDFGRHKRQLDGLRDRCRDCESRYTASRDVLKNGITDRALRTYSKSRQWFEEKMASTSGLCPGCGMALPEGASWNVDHDHSCCEQGSCGKCVRGILCRGCNIALGFIRDSPSTLRNLANYLERYAEDVQVD